MSTVATVTIMLILMTTIIIAANSISDNSKRISFASEIKSIQQAVNSYVTKNEGEYPTVNSIVVDISKLDPTYQTQFTANQESVVDGKIILNEIDYQKIGITDLKYGNGKRGTNDIYAVSTQTGKVYYVMGVTISNYSYYTLTSDLSKLLKLNDNQIDDTDPVIIFTPNKIEWTNQEIKVSIKIPKIFSLLEIKVNGTEISITDPIEEGSYNVYNVSNPGNYSIDVTYRKSEDSTENSYAKYSVTNFDNVAPTFTLSEAKKMEGGNLSSYVDITSKVENGSGLKKIKYEYNGIYDSAVSDEDKNSVKSHFENNGINLDTKATVIPITKGTRKLTVYMEDNAGNWSMQTLAFTQNTENGPDYVKNGLILHLDGINNTGSGHSNTSTIWKDLSGNNNNGTIKGASWLNDGLYFDGIDDWVPIKELNYNQFTLEAVFEPKDVLNYEYQYIICNLEVGGYGIALDAGNKNLFGISYNTNIVDYELLLSQNDINLNVKNTLTYTNDGKEHKLYLNGNLINSKVDENRVLGFPNDNTIMALGTNPKGATNVGLESFNGTIYSARMYNRVLTEQEVKNNYEIDKSRFGM